MIDLEMCPEETCPNTETCRLCYYCGVKRTHREDGFCSDKCRDNDAANTAMLAENEAEWEALTSDPYSEVYGQRQRIIRGMRDVDDNEALPCF